MHYQKYDGLCVERYSILLVKQMSSRKRIPIRSTMTDEEVVKEVETFLNIRPHRSGDVLADYLWSLVKQSVEDGPTLSKTTKQTILDIFLPQMKDLDFSMVELEISNPRLDTDPLRENQTLLTKQWVRDSPAMRNAIQSKIDDYTEWLRLLEDIPNRRMKRSIVEVIGERTGRFLPGALQSVKAYVGGRKTRRVHRRRRVTRRLRR